MDKVEILFNHFISRADTYAIQLGEREVTTWLEFEGLSREERRKHIGEYRRIKQPLTRELVQKHIAGGMTIGSYTVRFLPKML